MIDRQTTALIRPALEIAARHLVRRGVSADALTFTGLAIGWAAAGAIAMQSFWLGAALIVVSRLADGLDGAVARATTPTDRGGFLDISLDFLFYPSIPLAFAIANPASNALAAAVLLAAFVGTGTCFLAFATIAAKRGLTSVDYPDKSFYFLGGLTEATETLAFFIAMCLWPQHFAWLALAFAAMCAVTIVTRIFWGWKAFRPQTQPGIEP
ncbi:CDP-alcohol phosphatidyltransferase family protein [Caenimonas koreensis]|uniref:CDP-alcohol phosphatidyltransferase family protein n=1 Tax=Caenimonas koreensis TaxID=367474 RepID=UPI0037839A12